MDKKIFFTKKSDIGQKNMPIEEEFAKGGRVSPTRKGGQSPQNLIDIGVDGELWIVGLRKNGSTFWKKYRRAEPQLTSVEAVEGKYKGRFGNTVANPLDFSDGKLLEVHWNDFMGSEILPVTSLKVGGVTRSKSKKLTRDDVLESKIWIGRDVDTFKAVQKAVFLLGIAWISGGQKVESYDDIDFVLIHDEGELTISTESHDPRGKFVARLQKEIPISDLGITGGSQSALAPPAKTTPSVKPLTKKELNKSRIWVEDEDAKTKRAISAALNELGFKVSKNNSLHGFNAIIIGARGGLKGWGGNKEGLETEFPGSKGFKDVSLAQLGIDSGGSPLSGTGATPLFGTKKGMKMEWSEGLDPDDVDMPITSWKHLQALLEDAGLTSDPYNTYIKNKISWKDENAGIEGSTRIDNSKSSGDFDPTTKKIWDHLAPRDIEVFNIYLGAPPTKKTPDKKPSSNTPPLGGATSNEDRFYLDDSKNEEIEEIRTLLEHFDGILDTEVRKKLYRELNKVLRRRTETEINTNTMRGSVIDSELMTPRNLLDYYFTQTTQSPVAPIGKPSDLPTPNGKKSKLPLETYLAVRTPYFLRFFGDWITAYFEDDYSNCSLVIDEDTKEPRIMYHAVRKFVKGFGRFGNMGEGVRRPYGAFEPPKFPASYFGDNLDYVKFYAGEAKNMPKPSKDYEGFVYKIFMNMRNPIELDELGLKSSYRDFIDFIFVKYGIEVPPNKAIVSGLKGNMDKEAKVWQFVRLDASMIELFKSYGHDGIVQLGDIPVYGKDEKPLKDESKWTTDREYLSFYPDQIKSAMVKNSFYLSFMEDIRFKKGGAI